MEDFPVLHAQIPSDATLKIAPRLEEAGLRFDRHPRTGVLRLEVLGALHAMNIHRAEKALRRVVAIRPPTELHLDLSAVEFFDSSTVGFLLRWGNDSSLRVRIAGLSPSLRELFRIARLDEWLLHRLAA